MLWWRKLSKMLTRSPVLGRLRWKSPAKRSTRRPRIRPRERSQTFPRRQCCGLTATATSSNVRKVFSFLCFFFVFLFLFFFSYFFFCRRLSYRLLTHCILCFSLFLFFLSHLAAQLLSQNGRPARMTSITASDWCCLTVARRGST